jgi:regulator of RNase E activity RraB
MKPRDPTARPAAPEFDVQVTENVMNEAGNAQLTDAAQLRHATDQGRAIVTCDVTDFVALATEMIAANVDHAGIVLVSSRFRTDDFHGIAAAIEQANGRYPEGLPGAVLYLSRPA